MKIAEHVPFSALTTFKVGGSVRYVLTISPEECGDAVAFARDQSLPLIPLGGGSNMLGADGVCNAVMVRVDAQHITHEDTRVTAGAGAEWDQVVEFAVQNGLWGIENLSSIPGTVGGAVVQNIGAYGAALSNTLTRVDAFDMHRGEYVSFSTAECAFGYRTSVFKEARDRYIILSAELTLSRVANPHLEYKDLTLFFGTHVPTLTEIRTAVCSIRAEKFPPLAEYGTAGSFFLNPIMTAEEAKLVQLRYPDMPIFPLPEGGVKVPIAWFLDHVLALKGTREGLVHTWRDHVLVLVADEGASAAVVKNFMNKIANRALKELGIKIVPEVRVL